MSQKEKIEKQCFSSMLDRNLHHWLVGVRSAHGSPLGSYAFPSSGSVVQLYVAMHFPSEEPNFP